MVQIKQTQDEVNENIECKRAMIFLEQRRLHYTKQQRVMLPLNEERNALRIQDYRSLKPSTSESAHTEQLQDAFFKPPRKSFIYK